MTNNLTRFDQGGIELLIDTVTGESFATQRGYARMTNKSQSTINSRIVRMDEGKRKTTIKEAVIETQSGLQKSSLIPASLVLEFLAKDKPELITPFINAVKSTTGRDLPIPVIPSKKPKSSRKLNVKGYIYLFASEQILKLGFSINPQERLKQLERWNGELEIVCTVKGTEIQEKQLHSLLHQTGKYFGCEWYPVYRKHEILNLMGMTKINTSKGVEINV